MVVALRKSGNWPGSNWRSHALESRSIDAEGSSVMASLPTNPKRKSSRTYNLLYVLSRAERRVLYFYTRSYRIQLAVAR